MTKLQINYTHMYGSLNHFTLQALHLNFLPSLLPPTKHIARVKKFISRIILHGFNFLVHSLVFPAGPLVSILPTKNKMSKSQSLDQDRGLSTLAFPPNEVKLYWVLHNSQGGWSFSSIWDASQCPLALWCDTQFLFLVSTNSNKLYSQKGSPLPLNCFQQQECLVSTIFESWSMLGKYPQLRKPHYTWQG